jgi:pimeloyl-ACP methyl ester carboxylesterase
MPTITTRDGVDIFYKDWGSGQPIVFSHGWPLSSDDWDNQLLFFGQHGYRVVACWRGFVGWRCTTPGRPMTYVDPAHQLCCAHAQRELAAVTENAGARRRLVLGHPGR